MNSRLKFHWMVAWLASSLFALAPTVVDQPPMPPDAGHSKRHVTYYLSSPKGAEVFNQPTTLPNPPAFPGKPKPGKGPKKLAAPALIAMERGSEPGTYRVVFNTDGVFDLWTSPVTTHWTLATRWDTHIYGREFVFHNDQSDGSHFFMATVVSLHSGPKAMQPGRPSLRFQ